MSLFSKIGDDKKLEPIYKALFKIKILSAIFSLTVLTLLAIHTIQFRQANPVDSPLLNNLITKNIENPDPKLQNYIRQLDLLARKTYFESTTFLKTGAALLFLGLITLVGSQIIIDRIRPRLPREITKVRVDNATNAFRWKTPILVLTLLSVVATFFWLEYPTTILKRRPKISKDVTTSTSEGGTSQTVERTAVPTATDTPTSSPSTGHSTRSKKITAIPFSLEGFNNSWPSLRGPGNIGVVKGSNLTYPVKWSTDSVGVKKVALSLEGFNSPVIWNNRLYLSGASKTKRVVYCFEVPSLTLLWEKEIMFLSQNLPHTEDYTGYAASTLAVDGNVYAIFGTGELVSLSDSGEIIWKKKIDGVESSYGYSSSLLAFSNHLYVQLDQDSVKKIIALRTTDGSTVWEKEREVLAGWSSPSLISYKNNFQLILTGNPMLVSYDPFTGNSLWETEGMEGEVAPSAAYDEYVFTANEYASLFAASIENATKVWQNYETLPDVASPVAQNGKLYVATSGGEIVCYDSKSGNKLWDHQNDEGFYSSPIIAGNYLYFGDKKGKILVFSHSREKKLISENPLSEDLVTTPAFYNGAIYLRTLKHLYQIKSP